MKNQENIQDLSTSNPLSSGESKIYDSNAPRASSGTLYVLATPIGHMGDLTFRALEVLKQVHWIACEDTRRTLKLLNHYGISKPLLTIFGPREKRETPRILNLLRESQSVAVVTDAGTPGISDPGHWIVRSAMEAGFRVEPIPGVSALACALSVSGCAENGFIFLGFLPRKKSKIKRQLESAAQCERAIVFYESPYRVQDTLEAAREVFGDEIFTWVGREMTKKFEEYLSGPLGALADKIKDREILGEVTVILKP